VDQSLAAGDHGQGGTDLIQEWPQGRIPILGLQLFVAQDFAGMDSSMKKWPKGATWHTYWLTILKKRFTVAE
jgi:hypothetical protein